jgi:hypothetical protein
MRFQLANVWLTKEAGGDELVLRLEMRVQRRLRDAGRLDHPMENIVPEMFPGDPDRAAPAIYAVVRSTDRRHWVIPASVAYRRIGLQL